jgi:cyclin-dependent kinase
MRFTKYPSRSWDEILPGVEIKGRDLVSKLVVYESGDRLSAEEVCYLLRQELI